MTAAPTEAAVVSAATASPEAAAPSGSARDLLWPIVTAAVAAGVVIVTALEGGSYDVVPRQAAGVVLWWAVVLGALVQGRRLSLPSAAAIVATAATLGLGAWAALTIGGSLSTERSAVEVARWIAYASPLVLVAWVLPRALWRSVVLGLTAGATVVVLLALGERLSPGLLTETRTVVFEDQSQRLVEPLGYWNALGSWGAITGLLLLGAAAHLRYPVARAAALVALPAVGATVYLTYSRSSIVVTAVGLMVLVALARNRWTLVFQIAAAAVGIGVTLSVTAGQDEIATATGAAGAGSVWLAVVVAGLLVAAVGAGTALLDTDRLRLPYRTARGVTVALGVVAIAGVAVAGVTAGPSAWDQFSQQEEANSSTDPTSRLTMVSNGTRVEQWRIALESWRDDKLTGSGAGTYEITYNQLGKDSDFVRDAHSAELESLSEQGVVGLVLLVGLMAGALAAGLLAVLRASSTLDRGLAAGATAAVAAFFLGSSFDWFWEVGALAFLAMALVGALGAASSSAEQRKAPGGRVLPIGVAAVALVALLVMLPGLVGTSELRRSQQAAAAGDLAEARARANEAIDIQPWAASPFLQRALVDEQDGQWAASIAALKLAIDRDPQDWRYPLVLARAEAKAGDADEALAAYRDAKRLRPNGRFFQ